MDGSYLSSHTYGLEYDRNGELTGHVVYEGQDCALCHRGGYPVSEPTLRRRRRQLASDLGQSFGSAFWSTMPSTRPAVPPTQPAVPSTPSAIASTQADPPPQPQSPPIPPIRPNVRRRASMGFMTMTLCPHERLDEMGAKKILRRIGTTATHGLSLASAPQICRANWIQGWDLETRADFKSYKQGFQRPVLMLRRWTRISSVSSPLADIRLASEKDLRQMSPCPHFPLEKLRDELLRHVHFFREDDSSEATVPQPITTEGAHNQELAITLFDHWSCSICLTEYAGHLFITPHTTFSSTPTSDSADHQHPAYSLETTTWINLGCFDSWSWGSTSNFGRHIGDGSDTKSWLMKSTDWLFNDGEPWVRSPRRVWEEEDRCPRILWLGGIAARGLVGIAQGDVQSWSGVVLSVLSGVMLARPALAVLIQKARAP